MVQHIIGTGKVVGSRTEDCGFMVQHIIGGVTGMVSVLASRTEDCGFEPWSNTSSVVLQVWLACSPPEQKIVGSSHGPTHHRWCYRYG